MEEGGRGLFVASNKQIPPQRFSVLQMAPLKGVRILTDEEKFAHRIPLKRCHVFAKKKIVVFFTATKKIYQQIG